MCIFSKAGAAKYHLKHMFQIMAISKFTIIKITLCILKLFFIFLGTNVQINISEAMDDILVVLELDCIRFPLSLDELPQLVPYLDRLYNVIQAIHSL